jgi:hypothetical protein
MILMDLRQKGTVETLQMILMNLRQKGLLFHFFLMELEKTYCRIYALLGTKLA